jgi:hypothetical protein
VYQTDIMRTNPGLTVASTAPRKKRFVAIPANEVHAGVVRRIAPQAMVAYDKNLPMGRRWRA